ncbi:MAG: hypothetical protein ACMUJM_10330 [bacterium]
MNLNRKSITIFFLALSIVYIIVWTKLFYFSYQTKKKQLEKEVNELEFRLAYREEKIKRDASFDINLYNAAERFNSFIYKIPCFSKASSWEQWFRERALRFSLKVDSIFNEENKDLGDLIHSDSFTLNLRGDFLSMGEYFESLENDECLCAIDELEIKQIDSTPGSVHARVNVSVLNSLDLYDSDVYDFKNSANKKSRKFYYNSLWDNNPFKRREVNEKSVTKGSQKKEKGKISSGKKVVKKRGLGIDDITLNGIIFYNGEYIALMNDERFNKGDRLLGYTIDRIEKDNVYLTYGKERFRLTMYGQEKKKKLN